MTSQEENNLPLEHIWAVVRHRRWWLIFALVGCWGLLTAASWFIPPQYKSEAVVLIERQQVPSQYVVPNVTVDLQQRLDTITQQVLSRPRLLHIIDTYHLYAKQRSSRDNDAIVDVMRKDIGIELVTPQGARGRNDLTGFRISYFGPTAQVAQQVTGELTSLFIEQNLHSREQASVETTAFLQNQLDQAGKDLAEQETKLRVFKSRYLGQLPEQLQSNLQILSGLQARLQAESDALSRAQQQQLYLDSLMAQYKGMWAGSAADGSSPPALEQRLVELRNQLSQLSAKYTERHPDVLRIKDEIASTEGLKRKIEDELKNKASDATADLKGGQSMAQISSQLKASEFEIANRKREIKDLQAQIGQYQSRLNQTPVREQELAGIVRDHDQSLANYNSLLNKKLQSELATNLEKRQQGEQFSVIDPPTLPKIPDFPNRFKFSLIGIFVGLALGAGLIITAEFLRPLIYSEDQLKSLVKVSLVVSVPGLWTAREEEARRRRMWLQAIAATLLLALVPVGTLLTYLQGLKG